MYEQGKFVCYCGSKDMEIDYLPDGQTRARLIDEQFMASNINFIVCIQCGLMYNPFYYDYGKVNAKRCV